MKQILIIFSFLFIANNLFCKQPSNVNLVPHDDNGINASVIYGNSGYAVSVDSNGNVGVNARISAPVNVSISTPMTVDLVKVSTPVNVNITNPVLISSPLPVIVINQISNLSISTPLATTNNDLVITTAPFCFVGSTTGVASISVTFPIYIRNVNFFLENSNNITSYATVTGTGITGTQPFADNMNTGNFEFYNAVYNPTFTVTMPVTSTLTWHGNGYNK